MPNPSASSLMPLQKVDNKLNDQGVCKVISNVLPEHTRSTTFIQSARIYIRRNAGEIAKCTTISVIEAITNCAETGLSLGSALQHAHLIRFKDKCQFMPGFKGLVHLARQCGDILNVDADFVVEADQFSWQKGTKPEILHIPTMGDRLPGLLTHVYAVAWFRGSKTPQIAVMTRKEVEEVKGSSSAASKGFSPWNKWYAEMAKKTVIKRLCKLLPMTNELGKAVMFDDRVEAGNTEPYIRDINDEATVSKSKVSEVMGKIPDVTSSPTTGKRDTSEDNEPFETKPASGMFGKEH